MATKWVGLAQETTYGTKVATPAETLAYLSLDANPDQGLLFTEESDRREATQAVAGPFVGSGTLEILARPDTIGSLLKWAFGSVTSTQIGVSTMYKHTYNVADSLPSFTLQDVVPELNSRYLAGCLVKKLTLEAPARDLATMSVDILYAWEDLAAATGTYTASTLRPFVFSDGAVTLGGSSLANVEAFRWSIENTLPDDVHEVGARKIQTPEFEGTVISGELDLKFKSWSARQRFYGSAAATEPQTEISPFSLVLTLTGEPTGVTDKPNYELLLSVPSVVFTESESARSKQERLTQRVSFRALYNANNLVELYNKATAYSQALALKASKEEVKPRLQKSTEKAKLKA